MKTKPLVDIVQQEGPISGEVLNLIDLSNAKLDQVNLRGCALSNCKLANTTLNRSDLDEANITNIQGLEPAYLMLAYFSGLNVCKDHSERYNEQVEFIKKVLLLYFEKISQLQKTICEARQKKSTLQLPSFFWSRGLTKHNDIENILLSNPYKEKILEAVRSRRIQ